MTKSQVSRRVQTQVGWYAMGIVTIAVILLIALPRL